MVYDCSQSGACDRTTIHTTLAGCEVWFDNEPGSPTCNRTTDGLDRVALVADQANHIPGPVDRITAFQTLQDPLLRDPWDLEFAAEGRMYITLNNGSLVRGRPGALEQVGSVDVVDDDMGGLLGLALDPEFGRNRQVYLFYTYDWHPVFGGGAFVNRISRFTLTDEGVVNETVLVDEIPGGRFMNGGRLEIGPDGMLYATTGKAVSSHGGQVYNLPQDVSSLSGKVLRIHRNGSVPISNPYGSPVYSIGHKNPSGLAWHPVSGELYASEHGPWRHDEVNRVVREGNYGFPRYVCDEQRPEQEWDGSVPTGIPPMRGPVWCADDWTMAPGSLAFVRDRGERYHGDLFVTGLRGQHVRRLDVEDGRVREEEIVWFREGEQPSPSRRLRDIEYWNGSLWVAGDFNGMVRLTP